MLSICKLKWDMLRTSVTAFTIDKNTFSAPFGIFYVRTEIWKEIFQKNHIQTPNGVLLIFKLPFPNGSYCNGVCRALWAMSFLNYKIPEPKHCGQMQSSQPNQPSNRHSSQPAYKTASKPLQSKKWYRNWVKNCLGSKENPALQRRARNLGQNKEGSFRWEERSGFPWDTPGSYS